MPAGGRHRRHQGFRAITAAVPSGKNGTRRPQPARHPCWHLGCRCPSRAVALAPDAESAFLGRMLPIPIRNHTPISRRQVRRRAPCPGPSCRTRRDWLIRGGCRSAASTSLALAQEHGTPLFVYDEAPPPAPVPGGGGGLGRRCGLRDQGLPLPGHGPAGLRGGHVPRRLDRGRAARGPGRRGARRPAGPPRQQQVRGRAGAAPSRSGSGRIVVDSFDEIDRLERILATSRGRGWPSTGRVLVRVTPGVEAHTHEFVRTGQDDSKFGFGLASGAAAEAVARLRRAAIPGRELVGIHAHLGSQIFALAPFDQAVERARPSSSPRSASPSCASAAASASPTSTGEEAPPITEWAATRAGRAAGAAASPDSPGHRRARPVDRRAGGDHPATGSGPSRRSPATGPTSRSTAA